MDILFVDKDYVVCVKPVGLDSEHGLPEELKKQLGYEVDKKKIILDAPIKALGVTNIGIKLHAKVTTEIKVHVVEK